MDKDEDYSPGKAGRTSMLDKMSEDQEEFFEEELGDLDIPPSWSPKPYIDKEQFLNLTPLGEDTAFYIVFIFFNKYYISKDIFKI